MVLMGCASVLSLSAPAFAAADPAAPAADEAKPTTTGLDEIVVTARRKEESAQSVPVSVNVVSPTKMREANVVTLADLPRVTPGLTVTPSPLGSSRPAYEIRGQRASATRIQNDPAIVVYFGEVGQSRSAGTPQSLFDLQSVQVLKGPQGTLFGRNTTGGAILITPQAPTHNFEGYVQGSIGDYNMRAGEAVLNVPVGDILAIRGAVRIYRRDGFFENVLRPGEKSWDESSESYRLSVRFTPSTSITSDFVGTLFHDDTVGFQPKITSFLPSAFPIPALVPALTAEVAASNALGFYQYREQATAANYDNVKGIQNNTTIDLGDALFGTMKIKNILGYRKIKNHFSTFADGSGLGLLLSKGDYDGDQFSEELQLQGTAGRLDYVIGGFYSTESGDDLTDATNFGALPRNFTEFEGKNDSLSAFAHASYNLGGGLSIAGGARITHDKRKIDSHVRQLRTPTVAQPSPYACLATGASVPITDLNDRSQCSFVTKVSFTEPTWDIGLNYQIDSNHLLYVTHRHGYRSGAAASATTPNLLPEKVNDIEIGSKNQFKLGETPMRFNIAGYWGKYKNLQRNIAVVVNGVGSTQDRNAAKARVYGIESEFEARPSKLLTLNVTYALTIAKYDEYNDTINTAGGPVVVDDSSAIFSYTPKHMVNVSATFHAPVDPSLGQPSLNIGYSYQSSFQTTDSNSYNCGPGGIEKWCLNTGGLLPGYGVANLRLDWRGIAGSGVDAGFFVTNLFNKKYYAGAFALNNALGFQSKWPGAPRMFGFDLRYSFGGRK